MVGLSENRAFYKNAQVDELLHKAEISNDQEERTQLYQKAQEIVVYEATCILLFQTNSIISMRNNVEGFVYNPMLEYMYNFATMKKTKIN